jgi:S1-C subfamily serine protease
MDRPRSMVRSAAALCCASIAVSACGGEKPQASALASPQERLDLGVIGVGARIGGDDALGSGFVIDGDRGLVLTTAHTVWGARSLKLATGLGVLHGRIVARAPCTNLALLELYPRIPGLSALPAAPAGSAARGQLLRSLGRRRTDPGAAASAVASIPVRVAAAAGEGGSGLPLPATAVTLDSPLVPEVSGGPVVDQAGRLVGMAEAVGAPGSAAPAVTVPWARIRQRLGELKPGPRSVYVGWAGEYSCAGRQHAYAHAAHRGFRRSDAKLNAPVTPTRLPGTEGLDG